MGDLSLSPDARSRKGSGDRAVGTALLLSAALVAFVLYRPDTAAPFEIVDFSETLPILTDGRDFGERFAGLVRYYLGHGRAAFGLSAGLAAKWTLFEWWTPGWQWTRYLVSLLVVVLAWRLLRVLGANRAGAAAGASLFVVSETVAPGWLRPAVNEPLGTVLLLAASLVACRFQSSNRWRASVALIAALIALMILSKETLVAAAFFPVALALGRTPGGSFAWPTRSRRNVALVLSVAAAVAVMAVPVVWGVSQAGPEGYARQFGAADGLISNAIFGLLPALFPFTPISSPPGLGMALANIAWLSLLIAGWRALPHGTARRREAGVLLALGLLVPLSRLVVYLPWPLQFPYYSIPYLLGIAILAAVAVTRLTSGAQSLRVFAVAAVLIVSLYSAAGADAQRSRYFATRRLTDTLVTELHALARQGSVDSVLVAVPRLKEQAWWGLGPTLARFGAATDRPLPPLREALCAERVALLPSKGSQTAVVALRWQCELPPAAFKVLQTEARRFDANALRQITDTLHADIYLSSVRP